MIVGRRRAKEFWEKKKIDRVLGRKIKIKKFPKNSLGDIHTCPTITMISCILVSLFLLFSEIFVCVGYVSLTI